MKFLYPLGSLKPWENTWINNPMRPSGFFLQLCSSQILPEFLAILSRHKKQFRATYIIERSPQFNVKTQVESLSKTINYLISDINPACAGVSLKADYSPKPGESSI